MKLSMPGLLKSDKDALNRVFAAMRKKGFIARQNHCCCGGCSASKIACDLEEMPEERRAKVRGAIHYHRQTSDAICETLECAIQFGSVKSAGSMSTTEVGALLVETLKEEGLSAVWDGNEYLAVMVYFQGCFEEYRPRRVVEEVIES